MVYFDLNYQITKTSPPLFKIFSLSPKFTNLIIRTTITTKTTILTNPVAWIHNPTKPIVEQSRTRKFREKKNPTSKIFLFEQTMHQNSKPQKQEHPQIKMLNFQLPITQTHCIVQKRRTSTNQIIIPQKVETLNFEELTQIATWEDPIIHLS
ncbi:hypothetical protein Droror1_Dr00003429 [Drosera rotundifolia]